MCYGLIKKGFSMGIPVAVIYGDGIGPEIMEAVLLILQNAGVELSITSIEAGEQAYKKHWTSGIAESAWDILFRTKAILKSPVYTPSGGGYRSVNVSIRKRLELYANIRPVVSYYPFIKNARPNIDLVIIRENEEGSYTGVEYRRSHNAFESIRTVTIANSLRIAQYAFEYAKKFGRKRVDCMVKDNIMKMTDGCFYQMFCEIAERYNDIPSSKYLVDIGIARLAARPEQFDVLVTTNLYGDIASDVAAEISGSVGLAGSANIGNRHAMFEAVHGTAPDIAGKNIANPSGLLNAAVMMLRHLGLMDKANAISNAWLRTIELGLHTVDIAGPQTKKILGTIEFAQAVIKNLGQSPLELQPVTAEHANTEQDEHITSAIQTSLAVPHFEKRLMVGADIGVAIDQNPNFNFVPKEIAERLEEALKHEGLSLCVIFCKGLKIWPGVSDYSNIQDCCTLRIAKEEVGQEVSYQSLSSFVNKLSLLSMVPVKVDFLFSFDEKPGFAFADV